MTDARHEMSRFGFCQDQEPHEIFVRLAKLRNTFHPSRAVLKEIERIEREIEADMELAQQAYEEAAWRALDAYWDYIAKN